MITDKFLMVDANDPEVGWDAVIDSDMLILSVGTYAPLTRRHTTFPLVQLHEDSLQFLLSLSFCILSDRDLLKGMGGVPFYKVSTSDELMKGIEEAKKLWQT